LADKEDATNINVSSLKKQGAEILSAEYKTELSSYVFPDPGSIKSREFAVDKEWSLLDDLAKQKKAVLDADLKRELLKEETRLAFANTARDFHRFAQDKIQESKETNFGFTLQEVKHFKEQLDKQEKEYLTYGANMKKEYEKIHCDLVNLKVTENVYTKHTPESLNATQDQLHSELKEKRSAYDKELKRQQDNDALCIDFAHKAEATAKRIKSTKDSIANSTKPLDAQLQDVTSAQDVNEKSTEKADAKEAQEKINNAKITNNPHTVLTLPDLDVAFTQYNLFLATKKDVLEKEIEHKKLRGITQGQYAEIDRQFKKYDKDSSGKLDRTEFKACLYSLGEELGRREIQAIMDKYSGVQNTTSITYEQFKEFMIIYFGVTDTKQDITNAFKQIAAGDEKSIAIGQIVPRRMEVLAEEDLAFFKTSSPKTENRAESWEYTPFVEEVFNR